MVRERNFIQPGEMPYDQGLIFQDGRPLIYDSGDYPALLTKIKDLVGWDKFVPLKESAAAEGRRIGIGLACYVEGTGVGPYEGGHVLVETSGKVKVATGLTSQGQGHQTMLAQLVADELGVPMADVEVVTGDTRRFGYAVGTFASRTAVMSGSAVTLAARKAKEKALRVAAEAMRGLGPPTWRSPAAWCRSRAIPTAASASAPSRCCPTRCDTPSMTPRKPRRSSPARRHEQAAGSAR